MITVRDETELIEQSLKRIEACAERLPDRTDAHRIRQEVETIRSCCHELERESEDQRRGAKP